MACVEVWSKDGLGLGISSPSPRAPAPSEDPTHRPALQMCPTGQSPGPALAGTVHLASWDRPCMNPLQTLGAPGRLGPWSSVASPRHICIQTCV